MFQAAFRAQSDALLIWPIAGLVLFVAVFLLNVIVIMRRSKEDIAAKSRLPLEGDQS
ncbi:MAG: hypothetical protein IT381_15340 [Deltaproteobacteria bacterium]|nr:hypothetical protein [Deltaproteobacteria bacterium]